MPTNEAAKANRSPAHRRPPTCVIDRNTTETQIACTSPSKEPANTRSPPASASSITCWSCSPATEPSISTSPARATSTSTSTTPSKTSASRSARPSPSARRQARHPARRLLRHDHGRNPRRRRRRPQRTRSLRRRHQVRPRLSAISTELLHDFFDGFARGARANVHVKTMYGRSNHHKIEAIFKAFARALRVACCRDKHWTKCSPARKDCCDRSH